jgi:hypothetical protein
MKPNYQSQIEYVLNEFDFKRVRKAMKMLNWVWFPINKVPTIKQLKEYARNLINQAVENPQSHCIIGCGGFEVEKWDEDEWITLRFILEQVDATNDDIPLGDENNIKPIHLDSPLTHIEV